MEINVGHGHSVALFSMHLVSMCSCHTSVVRYQISASSAGMWGSGLVLLPCQTGAVGVPGRCLAPGWAGRARGTPSPLRALSRLPGPWQGIPWLGCPGPLYHTAEQTSKQRNWYLLFSSKEGEQCALAAVGSQQYGW